MSVELPEPKPLTNIFVKTIDYMNAEKHRCIMSQYSYNWPMKISEHYAVAVQNILQKNNSTAELIGL